MTHWHTLARIGISAGFLVVAAVRLWVWWKRGR